MGLETYLGQYDEIDISKYVESDSLRQEDGLCCSFRTSNQYTLDELENHLTQLSDNIKERDDVSIL
jgi:hypothetical protein